MTNNPNIKNPKKNPKYKCDLCSFNSNNKKDFNKHKTTRKHQILTSPNEKTLKTPKKTPIYSCQCGKTYKHASSLSSHKKKCLFKNNILINKQENNGEIKELKELIIEVIKNNGDLQKQNSDLQKQNYDLQKQVLDVCKTNNSNNIINSHNKTFNLQFFLNEECKDAMNLTDFINSVTLSLSDLENMGTSGYVNGISSIIIKELRGLDITKRPVHCSDAKRETLYIKDEDKWEKECPENTKMKTAIRTVEKKNIKLISEWTDKHPKFTNSTTRENDEYLQILIETMGGKGDYEKNKNKVIKNIAKEVVIDK